MQPGTPLGDWVVLAPVGSGGMAEVYRAVHATLPGLQAALKVQRAAGLTDEGRARFVREAGVLAEVRHPAVVRVLGLGEAPDGRLWMAQELLEGETLGERLQRGPLPEDVAVAVVQAVAGGLAAVHAQGVVHRDVKPGNVFLTRDGRTVLLDFGVATRARSDLTREGALPGTLTYLPPELFTEDDPPGPHTDVYALGLVLWACLTGRAPFSETTTGIREDLARVLGAKLQAVAQDPGPGASARVREAVRRATHPDPAERLADMDALLGALAAEGPRRRARWPWVLASVAGVAVVLAGGLGAVGAVGLGLLWSRSSSPEVSAELPVGLPVGLPDDAVVTDGPTVAPYLGGQATNVTFTTGLGSEAVVERYTAEAGALGLEVPVAPRETAGTWYLNAQGRGHHLTVAVDEEAAGSRVTLMWR